MTDDYSPVEVAQNLHIAHFYDDMWRGNIRHLRVYDEKYNLITKLHRQKMTEKLQKKRG